MSKLFRNPIFCGLDTHDLDEAERLAKTLVPVVGGLKIGLEFFYAFGRSGYERIAETGVPIFLDLKLHDIPNTVAGGIRSLLSLQPAIMNVHASGGIEMMKRARGVVEEEGDGRPWLIGVTLLTSLDAGDIARLGAQGSPSDQVRRLAAAAQEAGLDGVVCSPQEVEVLRQDCGSDFKLIVPGIRMKGESADDQKRVMTPSDALVHGADILVISRPIIRAADPAAAVENILADLPPAA
ncbi:orotidine 5'-phosphate decarboxylase [Tepidicaulis marinus]|uniref:Orotidine 5'-phosphate decarboxylase n=1 Tax=Tepidicaulis marinus TaxID=1333998 RepID=A0A081BE54_9HYPH|nr:orotidine-5'-phosphate decarboxylase [Tepidicaulis marinus]GAK46322.1 orotidine 5'-phosphate decarboxylase [Tepidicaulis marinus]